jgi:hypothetical protein
MNFPFSNWYQPISSGGGNYQFQDYNNLSNFSICKITVKNQISAVQSSIGADNTKILRHLVNRLLAVTNISSTDSFDGTTTQNYYVNYTYVEGKTPNPGDGGYSTYSFEVKKVLDNSTVSNGILTFLEADASVESYIDVTVNINQII